jgi:hypothetical protein
MIKETRAYINQQIIACYPDNKELDDPIGDQDLELSRLNDAHKVLFGSLSTQYDGSFYSDLVECTVEIYNKPNIRAEIDGFDQVYKKAIAIKNNIMNPLLVKNNDFFSDIAFTGIAPEALPSNDKVFKILLTFQIRKDFDFQGV